MQPECQIVVLSKRPAAVRAWVDRISRWAFCRIVPAHLQETIQATPADFKAAFGFLSSAEQDVQPLWVRMLTAPSLIGRDEVCSHFVPCSQMIHGFVLTFCSSRAGDSFQQRRHFAASEHKLCPPRLWNNPRGEKGEGFMRRGGGAIGGQENAVSSYTKTCCLGFERSPRTVS